MSEFDHNFKEFAAEDARGLLYMTGRLPLSAAAIVRPVPNELIAPQKAVDHLCVVETPERSWVEQFEALSRWHSREVEAILARTKTATMVPSLRGRDVHLTVVLLSEKNTPARLPRAFRERQGRFGAFVVPHYVRLWELDPKPMIDAGRTSLLPWIPLMRGGEPLAETVAAEIVRRKDKDLAARFVTVASLRYNKRYLTGLLEKMNMLLYTRELVESTPIGQEIYEEALRTGHFKASLEHANAFLRLRFPGLADHPALSAVSSPEQAHVLLLELFVATDEPAARAALARATEPRT